MCISRCANASGEHDEDELVAGMSLHSRAVIRFREGSARTLLRDEEKLVDVLIMCCAATADLFMPGCSAERHCSRIGAPAGDLVNASFLLTPK